METVKAIEGLKFIKKCGKCGRELPLSEFYAQKSQKDGHRSICKECSKAYERSRKLQIASEKKVANGKVKSIPLKANISSVSDSDLFDELKRRGYTGELYLSKVINL